MTEKLFAIGILTYLYTVGSIQSFTDLTDNAFGNHRQGVLAAFGDINSDELTDAFIITNRTALNIYLAYDREPLLRPSNLTCNFTNFFITSVIPGDYDGDAFMDVMITTSPLGDYFSEYQHVRILWGGKSHLNCSDAAIVKIVTKGQPLAIDFNQDMIVDLFGTNINSELVYWIFNNSRTPPKEQKMMINSEAKIPHSHSFIDFNNDNAPDLMISTKFNIEMWVGSKSPGFDYYKTLELPIGKVQHFGQTLYLDVALTGEFYILLPVCFDGLCKNSSILYYNTKTQWQPLIINFNDPTGLKWNFVPPKKDIYSDTITLRNGDYNLDGYPDLLVTLQPENSNISSIFLLINKPCLFKECSFKRTFEIQWNMFGVLEHSVAATFYDFYMDGILDIIYITKNTSSNDYSLHSIKNELQYDTNFINVIVLTGLINNQISETGMLTSIRKKKGTYGTNLPGPKIGYNMISEEGVQRIGVCSQLPQSAYFALHLPYSIFGLERTPNFVDSLSVGLSGNSKTWTQIIPNSQLVVIPYPPSDPSSWKAQLFVTPSKLILRSLFVLVAILFVISCCIAFLHWRERNNGDDVIVINRPNNYSQL